jgi:hypothetical protein
MPEDGIPRRKALSLQVRKRRKLETRLIDVARLEEEVCLIRLLLGGRKIPHAEIFFLGVRPLEPQKKIYLKNPCWFAACCTLRQGITHSE